MQSSGLAFKIDVQPKFGNSICRSVGEVVLSVMQQRGVIQPLRRGYFQVRSGPLELTAGTAGF